ncbi:MAG TPA: hypothetical protein VGJ20_24450 [Xanthobacteraceae bacterium]
MTKSALVIRGFFFAATEIPAVRHQLDPESARQVPTDMLGRRLNRADLRKLHQMLREEAVGATADSHKAQSGQHDLRTYPVRP